MFRGHTTCLILGKAHPRGWGKCVQIPIQIVIFCPSRSPVVSVGALWCSLMFWVNLRLIYERFWKQSLTMNWFKQDFTSGRFEETVVSVCDFTASAYCTCQLFSDCILQQFERRSVMHGSILPVKIHPGDLQFFSHLAVYSLSQGTQKETIPHPRDCSSTTNTLFCVQNKWRLKKYSFFFCDDRHSFEYASWNAHSLNNL